MNYEPTIPPTDSHQNAKAITQWAHNHTKSTLTINTYQPPDPTKPQHRMARPIITPVKPQSKAKTTQTTTTTTGATRSTGHPLTNPPNATK